MRAFSITATLFLLGIAVVNVSRVTVSMAQTGADCADAHTQQKLIVIYRSGATEKDKQRVRSLLKARVTAHFNDPNTEELTIDIPKSADKKRFIQKRLSEAKKDPAVQIAQVSASYSLD